VNEGNAVGGARELIGELPYWAALRIVPNLDAAEPETKEIPTPSNSLKSIFWRG